MSSARICTGSRVLSSMVVSCGQRIVAEYGVTFARRNLRSFPRKRKSSWTFHFEQVCSESPPSRGRAGEFHPNENALCFWVSPIAARAAPRQRWTSFRRLRCGRAAQKARPGSAETPVQAVEQQVDDRGRIERQDLRDQKPADDGDAERA